MIRLQAVLLALAALAPAAQAADWPPAVRETFLLDREWTNPLHPGSTVQAGNLAVAADHLDPVLAKLIADGLVEVTIGAAVSFAPHAAYIDATGTATLGAEPGVLLGYRAGRPFVESLSADDPRAGEKLAWNVRHAYGGDGGTIEPMVWRYIDMASGKVERTIRMKAASLLFRHRLFDSAGPDILPNPSGIFRALYLRVTAPRDIAGTQLLVHRLSDDHARERSWMYHANQRRVRLLASGQTTDAFLGSDIMIEDFLGYNGRIVDMTWTYQGRRDLLLPFFVDETAGAEVGFAGQGGCFPAITWQVRPADILEAVPKDWRHPLSKRVFYVDAQTATIALGHIYDRAGTLWKLGIAAFAHPDHHHPQNAGTGVPILAAVSMIDLQARHCTTISGTSRIGGHLSPRQFTVNSLRAHGR